MKNVIQVILFVVVILGVAFVVLHFNNKDSENETKESDVWNTYEYTEYGFAIDFPTPPVFLDEHEDFYLDSKFISHSYASHDGNTIYSVMAVLPENKPVTTQHFEEFKTAYVSVFNEPFQLYQTSESANLNVNGYPVHIIEGKIRKGGPDMPKEMKGLLTQTEQGLYLLTVISRSPEFLEDNFVKFFNSFDTR